LESFEINSTFPDYYILDKEKFLEEIGEKNTGLSIIDRFKKLFN